MIVGERGLRASVARIVPLAWPVLIGQLAVLAFATIDTVLVARHSSADLAALAVGSAAYVTIFIGFMGVVLAVGPIVGQLFGANKLAAAGEQSHQAVWIALGLSVIGCLLLVFPTPFLALAQATPAMADKVRGYLLALACSLPASLLFTVYRGFNTAVSRPKAVMALQLGALALKLPLTALLVFGAGPLPALGVTGCGIATAIAVWLQLAVGWQVLRRDRFYAPFALFGRGLRPPHRASLLALLALGLPMGLSILIEVTGFTFMAFFIARLGATPVAGHQIAANLISLMFMFPLALANAGSTLVAQRIGAGDAADARRLAWHSLQFGSLLAIALGSAVFVLREPIVRLYTRDAAVVAATLPLLAWIVLFHLFDAQQTVASFVLRAYRIATVPLVIYASAIWGVGLGGGYLLAFDVGGHTPASLRGATGFWTAATAGLGVAAVGLGWFLVWLLRQQRIKAPAAG